MKKFLFLSACLLATPNVFAQPADYAEGGVYILNNSNNTSTPQTFALKLVYSDGSSDITDCITPGEAPTGLYPYLKNPSISGFSVSSSLCSQDSKNNWNIIDQSQWIVTGATMRQYTPSPSGFVNQPPYNYYIVGCTSPSVCNVTTETTTAQATRKSATSKKEKGLTK